MNKRQDQIIEILKLKKNVSIDYLCQTLTYSRSTIRRDIMGLEEIGLVKRDKGYVGLLVSGSKEKHFKIRNRENLDKKKIIAELAIDFITDGMSIFLDASSTVLQLCPYLCQYKNLTVVTNGIEIADYLIKYSTVEIFMVGGYVREGSTAVVGEPAIDYMKQFNLDLAILSANGLDEKGFYEPSLQQSIAKRCMIENADMSIVLCDSSKMGQRYKFTLAYYDEVSYLITDSEPPLSVQEGAHKSNCEIIYLGKE